MGYDCNTVNEAGHSIRDRDCDDPEHGGHYWRRGAFSAQGQAQKLVDAGIGYWPMHDKPPWPEREDAEFGEFDEDLDECPPLNDAARELMAAQIDYLKATYSEEPGISVYKLCNTNDGWWVSAIECKSALALWERNGCPDIDDDRGDTIPFLRAGADHAGFRVW